MSLDFMLGGPGSGKSYTLYSEMIQASLEHPEKQYLIIVPEQFTMQTQREIAEMHPGKGLLNIDVLSFNRLAWRVFAEVGGNNLPVLDDTGKTLVIRKVIDLCAGDLKVMGRTLEKNSAAIEMKSLVSELLQYRVSSDDLDMWISGQSEGGRMKLAGKLEDVKTIYSVFCGYLKDHYLTMEEMPEVLCDVISESLLVKGSEIILDGFTGFTPVQEQVIKKLLVLADRVTAVLTVNSIEGLYGAKEPQNLFNMTWKMHDRLSRLAEEAHVTVSEIRVAGERGRSRFAAGSAIGHLERNIFRYGRKKKYQGRQNEIRILEASDPLHEITAAAGMIKRMVRESGGKYHYRDFAILTGDPETYGRAAERVFESAGIPYFVDMKHSVLTNPAVEFVRAAVDMAAQQYSYESVFRFLRTGMTDFSPEEIDDLDNYCLALGIRGRKQYEEPWRRTSSENVSGLKKAVDPEKLLYYNSLRQRFVDLTSDFNAGMHERMGTAARKTEVLYNFICRNGIQEKLERFAKQFESTNDRAMAAEYSQVYRAIMDLLDKVVNVLGDEKMRLDTYQEILDAGFADISVGVVPPGEDQVMVGDIERTRLRRIRVLFLAGVNDGIVPAAPSSKGILSEPDREYLALGGAKLAPTARQKMYEQRFYLYLALSRPSDRLFISFCRSGADGKAARPSYLINNIRNLFEDPVVINMEEAEAGDMSESLETPIGEEEYLLKALRGIPGNGLDAGGRALIWHLMKGKESSDGPEEGIRAQSEKTAESEGVEGRTEKRRIFAEPDIDRMLEAASAGYSPEGIPAGLAVKLYGSALSMSATRLENFSACPFRHFLDYGLMLQEREEYEFTPADFGSVMHDALRRFSEEMQHSRGGWTDTGDAERDAAADRAVTEAVSSCGNTVLMSSERNAHMIVRLKEMMRRTVWALQIQVRRGSFRPSDFEFRFAERDSLKSMNFRLGGNVSMGITGRVDRMDECVFNGVRYLKIIDYKTGSTDIDLNQMYAGLQLQLSLYMNAALEREGRNHPEERAEPAGIFYYHIKDPLVDLKDLKAGEVSDEKIDEAMLKELRPSGIVRSEYSVLRLMDHETERGVSDVLPAGVKIEKSEAESGGNEAAAAFGNPEMTSGPAEVNVRVTEKASRVSENRKSRSAEEFRTIAEFTERKIAGIGNRMIGGDTSVSPYVQYSGSSERNACTFCPYGGVCGFDERVSGFSYRRIGNRTIDEVLEDMRRENRK